MEKSKKPIGLTTKIFVALILGAITGIIIYFVPAGAFRDNILVGGIFNIVGNGFLRAMQMLVVPLVLCSLVCGSMAIGDTKKLGKVGIKIILMYMVTTAVAISIALFVANIFNPGIGLDLSAIQTAETTIAESKSFSEVLLNIIPKNPVKALADGEMLQIIFFAIIIGVLLANLGEKAETVSNFFSQFNDLMMKMTMVVMKVAPIGVFCLIAKTFSDIGFRGFKPMFKYMFCVLLALVIQCFVIYMIMLKSFTGLNPIIFIKKFLPVMGFAFSTATSNATIPLSINTLSQKMGVSRKISSFTIPLGATINMDGTAIMQGVAVVFVAQAFGIPLDATKYLMVIAAATLASVGTAGVPSVGLITLSMVFTTVGLPVEGITLIMGIDRILDMARTAVNITGDAVCTTIVASQDNALDRTIFNRDVIESD